MSLTFFKFFDYQSKYILYFFVLNLFEISSNLFLSNLVINIFGLSRAILFDIASGAKSSNMTEK